MKLVIFDIDGVIMRGKQAVPCAADTIRKLQNSGKIAAFLTNNSTQIQSVFSDRLHNIGIDVEPEDVMTSSIATADYIKSKSPDGARVLVVGETGIIKAMQDNGIEVVDYDDPETVDYVVVGMDRKFTYEKLARAQREILYGGAEFIATNCDVIFPIEDGKVRPGGGVMVRAIEACTNVTAKVIGKPETTSIDLMLKKYGVSEDESAIVGDNLDTDILAGKRAGIRTVFVLTGIHTMDDLKERGEEHIPDYVIKDLSCLEECLF